MIDQVVLNGQYHFGHGILMLPQMLHMCNVDTSWEYFAKAAFCD